MNPGTTRSTLARLLFALILVSAQGAAFAHEVDGVSHQAQTLCDLCVAGHALGSAASAGTWQLSVEPAGDTRAAGAPTLLAPFRHPCPRQRAPPVSR